jgi:hypothetical protein
MNLSWPAKLLLLVGLAACDMGSAGRLPALRTASTIEGN